MEDYYRLIAMISVTLNIFIFIMYLCENALVKEWKKATKRWENAYKQCNTYLKEARDLALEWIGIAKEWKNTAITMYTDLNNLVKNAKK